MGCSGSKAVTSSAPQARAPTLLDGHGMEKEVVTPDYSNRVPLRRQRTVLAAGSISAEVMVVGFSTHEDRVHGHRDTTWQVQFGHNAVPVEIKLHAEKAVVSFPQVGISCDGKSLYPTESHESKAKLREDLSFQIPFRGVVDSEILNEPGRFEVRVVNGLQEGWCPAKISAQRDDGLFAAVVCIPDQMGGIQEVPYPALDSSDIRAVGTHEFLRAPDACLFLDVPHKDPQRAVLSVNEGAQSFLRYLAWPSPHSSAAADKWPSQLVLNVSKDRNWVEANVGHQVLSHFLSGEVRCVRAESSRSRHTWTIQLGPFAEHTIELERKHMLSKAFSLSIDGKQFVECAAEDLGCGAGEWACDFRFVGERVMCFDVFETNADGVPLDSRGNVTRRTKYTHRCTVKLTEKGDLWSADLFVDGEIFNQLPLYQEVHTEDNLAMETRSLQLQYGVVPPCKVNADASVGVLDLLGSWYNTVVSGTRAVHVV